jgi:hypothetical protein
MATKPVLRNSPSLSEMEEAEKEAQRLGAREIERKKKEEARKKREKEKKDREDEARKTRERLAAEKASAAAKLKEEKAKKEQEEKDRVNREREDREEREREEKKNIAREREEAQRRIREEEEEWERVEEEAARDAEAADEERRRAGPDSGTCGIEDEDEDLDFQVGRTAYLEKSEVLGRAAAARGEGRIQDVFDRNKNEKNFRDGFLVGALFFHSGAPAVGQIQAALTKMGMGGIVTPITKAATEPRNYEIRVWEEENKDVAHRTIIRRGGELAKAGNRAFRWKDLRTIDSAVIKVTGLPFQWEEKEVRNGLFTAIGFPTTGLLRIVRIAFNGKPSGEVQLVYLCVPERIISWGRIARNEFKCSKTKIAAWRVAYPPHEYDAFAMCEFCNWNHSTRVDCEVKIQVENEGGWLAYNERMEEANRGHEKASLVPYTTENFESAEFSPPEKETTDARRGGRGGRGARGGSGRPP